MKITQLLFFKKLTSAILKTEQEISIRAPWGKLAAVSWGDPSNHPVLFCHGMMDCSTSFRPLVSLLPTENFYVSIDLPGNGKSDRLPQGVMLTPMDMVPSLKRVQDHFKWEKFTFIGHSMGGHIGMFHTAAHPESVARAVLLDPHANPRTPSNDLRSWYQTFYQRFYDDYDKFSAGLETAPKYTYEEIRERMKAARKLTDEAVEHILERCLAPAGDGLYRTTFDQRQRLLMFPPITTQQYQQMWTTTNTPILSVVSAHSVKKGYYDITPYVLDDSVWPAGEYRHVVVKGGHDVHLNSPEVIVDCINTFLDETRGD